MEITVDSTILENHGDYARGLEEQASVFNISALPTDIWGQLLQYLHEYDIIFLRASSKSVYRQCKAFRKFANYSVLDQNNCMDYLVHNGFISCLDYVKDDLHFVWDSSQLLAAARSGRVDVLKHLLDQSNLVMDLNTILLECTKGTCNLSMIKYLHECEAPWNQITTFSNVNNHSLFQATSIDQYSYFGVNQTVMECMAYQGHLDCMKYAIENGCAKKAIHYTPSIECLDFAIEHGFKWTGGSGSLVMRSSSPVIFSFCEEAAKRGHLDMLKHAHQKGAELNKSALIAAQEGHLQCLIYAAEHGPALTSFLHADYGCKTIECFKYMLQKCGLETVQQQIPFLWIKYAGAGNMDMLQYLHQNNFPLDKQPIYYEMVQAAATAHLSTFKFMMEELKVTFDLINPYSACIMHHNVEGLKFALERNFPIDFVPPRIAGNPKLALQDKNHQFIQRHIVLAALESSRLDIVKFIWNLYPAYVSSVITDEKILLQMAGNSRPEIIDFLRQQGAQWTLDHFTFAVKQGNLANVAFFVHQLNQMNDKTLKIEPIIKYKHRDLCLKYITEHGWKITNSQENDITNHQIV